MSRHRWRQASARPIAAAPAMVEWLLGNDQSPYGGQGTSEAAAFATARQGRSSWMTDLNVSLST